MFCLVAVSVPMSRQIFIKFLLKWKNVWMIFHRQVSRINTYSWLGYLARCCSPYCDRDNSRYTKTRDYFIGLAVFTILHQLKFDHPVGRGFLPLSRLWRRRQEEIRSHGEARSAFTFETKSSSLTCQLRTWLLLLYDYDERGILTLDGGPAELLTRGPYTDKYKCCLNTNRH